ncbi:MAG: hypothetical protein AAFV85_24650 [Cyanobacteria bacterium J06634_6]
MGKKSYWAEPYDSARDFLNLDQKVRDQFKLVRGHIDFGWHRWFSDDSQYITILRNPQKRVFSYLNYWKQEAESYPDMDGKWFYLIRNYSPEEILSEKMHYELENGMVRQLSGKGKTSERCSEQDLHIAMHNLEKEFLAFGLTDRFDESLAVLSQSLGWRFPILYSSAKVRSKNLIEPSNQLSELISESNLLDAKLYQFAQRLFEERFKGLNLSNRVARIQQVNQLLRPLHRAC